MQYIGFNSDEKTIEKIKVISFITKKNRTVLLNEGLDLIIEKYSDCFDDFQKHIKNIKK